MADNLTAGNPRAHKVRVYYEASDTIQRGQAVCYNYDTTANWFGGSVANDGTITTSTTTAEGSQNEGKYIRVEKPTADNAEFFAGVVAQGGWVGKTGPRVVDIYIPNGAVVPVRTDKSIVIKDKLYLEHGEYELINATQVGMGICVAVADETVDRTSPAGIVLAKLKASRESTVYGGTLGVGLSEALWEDCPIEEIERNPGLGIVYFDDFNGSQNTVSTEGWTISNEGGGTGTLSLVADEGGAIVLDTAHNDTADDGVEAQLLNCRFLPKAGNTIWFEARVKVNDGTDQYFVGLAATDTTLIDSSGVVDDASDKAAWFAHGGHTNERFSTIVARTTEEVISTDEITVTDNAYKTLGFRIKGLDSIEFYSDGVLIETMSTTANIPNAAMCLSLACKVEETGADAEMTIDWVKIVQLGARV